MPAYVLHDFAKADEDWLDDALRGISDGAASLADGDFGKFMNAVSLRVAPPRSSKSAATKVEPAPAKKAPDPEDTTPEKTPLQKLMEKFR